MLIGSLMMFAVPSFAQNHNPEFEISDVHLGGSDYVFIPPDAEATPFRTAVPLQYRDDNIPENGSTTLSWESGDKINVYQTGVTSALDLTQSPTWSDADQGDKSLELEAHLDAGEGDSQTLQAIYTNPDGGDSPVGEREFTLVKLDLDVDANYDGTIDDDDEADEASAGGLVFLNDDDDDQDGTPDKDQDGAVAGEDDLIEIKLSLDPDLGEGEVRLEVVSGSDNIKVWDDSTKTTEIDLSETWDLSSDTLPSSLFVEAIAESSSPRDVELILTYQPDDTLEITDSIVLTLLKVDVEEVWSNQFAGIEVNKLPGQSGFQGRGYLVNGGEEYLLIGSASDGSTSFKVKFNMPNIPEIHDLVKFTLLSNGSVSLPLLDPVHTDIDWSSKIATVDFNIDEYTNDYDGFSVLMYLDLNSNNYFDASEPVLVDSILSNGSRFHLKFVDPARYFSAQVLGVGGAIYGGTLGGTPDAASYLATFSTGNAPSGAVALNANLSIADDHPDHNVGVVFNNSGVGSVENYVFGSQSDFSFRVLDSASMADLLRLVIGSHYLEIADAFSTTPMEDRLIGGNLSFTFQIDDFRNHIVFDSSDENIQFALGTAGIIGSVEVIVSEFDGAFFSEAVAVDGNVIDMYDWDYDGNLGAYDDDFAALQTGYNTLGEGGHIFKSRIRVEGSIPGFTFQITPNPNNPF